MGTYNKLSVKLICTCVGLLCAGGNVTMVGAFQQATSGLGRIPTGVNNNFSKQPLQLEQARYRYSSIATDLKVTQLRDADFIEMMVGGERYEMIPLPDSMVPTTVFVGNLCEFVNDDILSNLFQDVSTLNSVPACVARKPNTDSLQYGFVTFPTVEEKEAAILRFHGYELHGRRIKVEDIKVDPNFNRVRVPERMVLYACGEVKKTRDGRTNSLRRNSHEKRKKEASKHRRQANSHNKKAFTATIRLNEKEHQAMDRAVRRGYVELSGTGYRRGRKGSALATMHRQFCDEREKPQIILCKATGGRPLDNVIVDLSPLRMSGLFNGDQRSMNDFLLSWKKDILIAANEAGMELRDDYEEDNSVCLREDDSAEDPPLTEYVIAVDSETWTEKPIFELPAVSMGVFEGDRAKAKQMARELADLWDIPELVADANCSGRRTKSSRAQGEHSLLKYRNKTPRRRKRRERDVW